MKNNTALQKEIEQIKNKLSSQEFNNSDKKALENDLAKLEKSVAESVDVYEPNEDAQNKNPQEEYSEDNLKNFELKDGDSEKLEKLCAEIGIKHTRNDAGEIAIIILPKGCSSDTLHKALDGDQAAIRELEEACKQEEYMNKADRFIENLANKKRGPQTEENSWVSKIKDRESQENNKDKSL